MRYGSRCLAMSRQLLDTRSIDWIVTTTSKQLTTGRRSIPWVCITILWILPELLRKYRYWPELYVSLASAEPRYVFSCSSCIMIGLGTEVTHEWLFLTAFESESIEVTPWVGWVGHRHVTCSIVIQFLSTIKWNRRSWPYRKCDLGAVNLIGL